MRKITSEAVRAFEHGGEMYKNTNTKVFYDSAGTWLELHGSRIAHRDENGLEITNAGWATATTKERLNAIEGVHIQQKAGVWYLNGREWDGEWVNVQKWDIESKACRIMECKSLVNSTKTVYCSRHLI